MWLTVGPSGCGGQPHHGDTGSERPSQIGLIRRAVGLSANTDELWVYRVVGEDITVQLGAAGLVSDDFDARHLPFAAQNYRNGLARNQIPVPAAASTDE